MMYVVLLDGTLFSLCQGSFRKIGISSIWLSSFIALTTLGFYNVAENLKNPFASVGRRWCKCCAILRGPSDLRQQREIVYECVKTEMIVLGILGRGTSELSAQAFAIQDKKTTLDSPALLPVFRQFSNVKRSPRRSQLESFESDPDPDPDSMPPAPSRSRSSPATVPPGGAQTQTARTQATRTLAGWIRPQATKSSRESDLLLYLPLAAPLRPPSPTWRTWRLAATVRFGSEMLRRERERKNLHVPTRTHTHAHTHTRARVRACASGDHRGRAPGSRSLAVCRVFLFCVSRPLGAAVGIRHARADAFRRD